MNKETLKKGIQIETDIEYLKQYKFVNTNLMSQETINSFTEWKQKRIVELQKEFNKL